MHGCKKKKNRCCNDRCCDLEKHFGENYTSRHGRAKKERESLANLSLPIAMPAPSAKDNEVGIEMRENPLSSTTLTSLSVKKTKSDNVVGSQLASHVAAQLEKTRSSVKKTKRGGRGHVKGKSTLTCKVSEGKQKSKKETIIRV